MRTFDSAGLRHTHGNTPLDLGVYNHVAFSYNGGNGVVKFYKNGVLDAEKQINLGAIDAVGVYLNSIGASSQSNTPSAFSGIIDELRVSNTERIPNPCRLKTPKKHGLEEVIESEDVLTNNSNITWGKLKIKYR